MRAIPVLTLALAAACSSRTASGPSPSGPMSQTLRVAGSRDGITIGGDGSLPTVHMLDAGVDIVWRALPSAFDSLGVPVTRIDAPQRVIGTDGFTIRQRLKNVALSRYVDCGQTQIGPNADSYEVFITLLVHVRPGNNPATSSSLVTTFEASARPLAFSQAYSRCSTKATLERRLLEIVKAQLK